MGRLHVIFHLQVSPKKKGRVRFVGRTASLLGREEPWAARQGRVCRAWNPVRQRPPDRSLQGQKPKAKAGCNRITPKSRHEISTGKLWSFSLSFWLAMIECCFIFNTYCIFKEKKKRHKNHPTKRQNIALTLSNASGRQCCNDNHWVMLCESAN